MNFSKHHRRTERLARGRAMIGKRFLLHGLVAVTAVAGVAAFEAADAVQAVANSPVHPTTTLTLTNGTGAPGQWAATGNTYSPGLNDVQIWVMDVTHGGWSTLEYQSGLTTSARLLPLILGGGFSAAGELKEVLIDPDVGYREEAVHPLKCGHKYEAVTDDPIDGYVYGNVLSEPACT